MQPESCFEFHSVYIPLPGKSLFPPTAPLMGAASAGCGLKIFLPAVHFRAFCTPPSPIPDLACTTRARARVRVRASPSAAQLKEDWLGSLSCPFHVAVGQPIPGDEPNAAAAGSEWVLGIDPDVSGALAVLKPDGSAQVFDAPHIKVLVGKRVRKRLDARSIVQLLHDCGAPLGTSAYIEQSTPFPKDGKQGWWSGGYTYGLWIGALVASGYSVVPVSSRGWKDHFELSRNSSSKDDSRKTASILFPLLCPHLKRKKDHGRAEALLIAAYGKDLKIESEVDAT